MIIYQWYDHASLRAKMDEKVFQISPTYFWLFLEVPFLQQNVLAIFGLGKLTDHFDKGGDKVGHPPNLFLIKLQLFVEIGQLFFGLADLERGVYSIIFFWKWWAGLKFKILLFRLWIWLFSFIFANSGRIIAFPHFFIFSPSFLHVYLLSFLSYLLPLL